MEFSTSIKLPVSLKTDYELIKAKFEKEGYTTPALVFWNVKGEANGRRSKPVTIEEKKVTMVSGYSGKMLRHFLKNGTVPSTPEEMMKMALEDGFSHLNV